MRRLPYLILLSILLVPSIAPAADSEAVDQADAAPATATEVMEVNGYPATSETVEGLTVHFPAGRWTVETDSIDERRSMVRLIAKSDASIILTLFVTRDMPAADAHYLNHPNFVNTAVLLPLVLDLTNKDESRIFFSVGSANLPDYWDASTRATVLMDDQHAIHVEACHQLHDSGNMVSALVSTRTRAGQVLEDPDYTSRVVEAYMIIQNLKIGQ